MEGYRLERTESLSSLDTLESAVESVRSDKLFHFLVLELVHLLLIFQHFLFIGIDNGLGTTFQ